MFGRHLLVVDAAVPFLVAAAIVAGELLHGGGAATPAALALGVASAAVLSARRAWPGLTLAVSGALVAVLFHLDSAAGSLAVIAPAVALYSLAVKRGRLHQVVAGLAAVAAVIAADVLHQGQPGLMQTLAHVMLVGVPLLAAEAIRNHRAYVAVLVERLELAERTREREAERRAEQERMQIARELHDLVAHTLTAINVQAAAAAERSGEGEARNALERIEQASHSAIGELRAILGVLRAGDEGGAPRGPAPGLDGVPELIARAREDGLDVAVEITGEPSASVSDSVSLAAYRIVQESLTNARRHARGAPVRVALRFEPDRLGLAVENAEGAKAVNGTGPGVGIQGMVERAAAVGGTVAAEPVAGGFQVRAELPYAPRA